MPYDPRSRAPARGETTPPAPPARPAWHKIGDEPDAFARLMALDALLVKAGFHPMSPWWREVLRAFYASRKRWLVVLAGRGSGKSTTLIRVAVAEALFTPRKVPTGQFFAWPFVSVHMNDSRARIREIAAVLRAIGIADAEPVMSPTPKIETKDVAGNDVAFMALAGTVTALSGPTTLGATVDEEQKLRGEGAANPAAELLASLTQTFRARQDIRAIRCSSAWSAESTHAAAVRDGDNPLTMIARLGEALDAARAGFLEVAAWEEAQGDIPAATAIRTHAATLTAASPEIPTFAANPTIGALASRLEVQALAQVPGGLSRVAYWMRENGSALGAVSGGATSAGIAIIPGRYANADPRREGRPGGRMRA